MVLALASDEVESVARSHRDLFRLAFPVRGPQLADLVARPGVDMVGRGFALIDPSSRRQDWLIRTSLDGRRSRLPFASYSDAAF